MDIKSPSIPLFQRGKPVEFSNGKSRFDRITTNFAKYARLRVAVVLVLGWLAVTPSYLHFWSESGLTARVWLTWFNCNGMCRIKALPACRSADLMRCEAPTGRDKSVAQSIAGAFYTREFHTEFLRRYHHSLSSLTSFVRALFYI